MKEFILKERQHFYTTVYALEYSPCGNYIAGCDNYGRIGVFSLTAAFEFEAEEDSLMPINSIKAHDGHIYSLTSTSKFLISGGPSEICGWKWTDLIHAKDPRPAWTLPLEFSTSFVVPETIGLDVNSQEDMLISAGRDSIVHVWDLETGKQRDMLCGHKDYIHSVKYLESTNRCVSGGEDGSLRMWDCRTAGQLVEMREPYKLEDVARPHIGKWIGCIAVDASEDWLVCGGGPSLSLWRLSSLTMTTVLSSSSCAQSAIFHEDEIITGGTEPVISHWTMDGKLSSTTPCTSDSVFAVAANNKASRSKVLCVGGSTPFVDVFPTFHYKAFSFKFRV